MKRHNANILLNLYMTLALILLAACESHDEEEQGIDATTYAVAFEVGTRAAEAGAQDDPTEKMRSLLLFVVNNDANNADYGKVEAMISKDFTATGDETTYKEILELTTGSKKIYGFANLTTDMCAKTNISALKAGDDFPTTIDDVTCRTDQRDDDYIPMSDTREITVNGLPGQGYTIPLTRLICKITFTVTNESGYPIELQGIVTAPITPLESPVYLLPHPDSDGNCQLPSGTTPEAHTWAWPAGNQTLSVGAASTPYTIYLNESKVADNGWFTFQLNTVKEGTANQDRFSISNIQVLNRNDHLPVNITLTDYMLRLDVLSYPPIGGYPSVDVPMKDKEYYAHFPGGGPFIITPRLSKYSTGEEVTEGVTWSMKLEGDTDIFDVQPVLKNAKNGEVIGTLKYAQATDKKALCTLTATVTEAGTAINRVLTYKVYIMNYQ